VMRTFTILMPHYSEKVFCHYTYVL
jgi:hypothetical protein